MVRVLLSLFALLNAACWGVLAVLWNRRPDWDQHLPFTLTIIRGRERALMAAPKWARLSAALAGFWVAAAGLYRVSDAGNQAAVIVLFTIASCFLIIGIVAGGSVYRTLAYEDRSASASQNSEQPI